MLVNRKRLVRMVAVTVAVASMQILAVKPVKQSEVTVWETGIGTTMPESFARLEKAPTNLRCPAGINIFGHACGGRPS